MVTLNQVGFNSEDVERINSLFNLLRNKTCFLGYTDRFGCLVLNFGDKFFHNNESLEIPFYGEVQLRHFSRAWSLLKDNQVLISGDDFEFGRDEHFFQVFEGKQLLKIKKENDFYLCFEDGVTVQVSQVQAAEEEEPFLDVFVNNEFYCNVGGLNQ